MVGVRAGLRGDLPCLVPCQVLLVHEYPHELGYGHGGVGIIHLNGDLLVELSYIAAVSILVLLYKSLQSSGYEEVLLLKSQLLACVVVVVRVEHLNEVLSEVLLLNCPSVIALVESVEREYIDGLRVPDAKSVDHVVAVAHYRHIIGNRSYRLVTVLEEMIASGEGIVLNSCVTAEFYLAGVLGALELKGVAML